MALCTSAIGIESHAAVGTKGSQVWGVWFVFSNNNFQFLNNITRIFTHFFHTFFHPHVFLQMFSNNNFQFLNTCTKQALGPPGLQ